MTKKRFSMKGSTILENNEEITAWDCCDLLNELHEENTSLKTTNGEMEDYLARLEEENQRLQKKLDCITKSLQNELNQYGGFR